MGLDLTLGDEGEQTTAVSMRRETGVRRTEAPSGEELARLHEMLLHRIDEMRDVASRLEDGGRSLGEVLGATDAMLRRKGEEQERTMREAIATMERQRGETAARFRVLADDLTRRVARIEGTFVVGNALKRALPAFTVGALVAILSMSVLAWTFSPSLTRLMVQEALGLGRSAPTSLVGPDAPAKPRPRGH